MVKCLSLANGRRQLPLVTGDQELGTGPERPSPGQPHLWTYQGSPWQGRGERQLQLRNSASPGRDPNPRPLAQAPAQRPPSEEGRGQYSRRGGGPEEAGRPNPPTRALRAGADTGPPPSAPARRLGPRQPACCQPAAPLASRPCPAPARAPALALTPANPGAPHPRPFSSRGPRRAAPQIPAPPPPPGPYSVPRPPLPCPPPAPVRGLLRAAFALAPPTRSDCLPSAAVTAAQPSAPPPRPLPP